MSLFKDKITVEDEVSRLLNESFPKAVAFLDRENEHAHRPVKLPEDTLLEIGAGMCLFFLASHLPGEKTSTKDKMSRAFLQVQQLLRDKSADSDKVYSWWKHYTDGLIFKENEERLRLACKLTWEKLYPDKPYKEPTPLRSFGYFLQMEVDEVDKHKMV